MSSLGLSQADFTEAHLEIARRSTATAMSYGGLLLVVGLFTSYFSDHPYIFNIAIATMMLLGVARIFLGREIERRVAQDASWGQDVLRWAGMASGILWGMFAGVTLVYYEERWAGIIVLLMTAGLAAGGIASLSPDILLGRLYLAAMLLPSIIATLMLGGVEGYGVAITITIFAAFLLIQSKQQNRSFWQSFGDRTALRAKAQELEVARKLADEATVAKSNFLAKMSHEIRTPMNGVIGMTELLLDSELDSQSERFVRAIRDSSEALLEIVNDILDLSKIESGKLELDTVNFDLRDSINDVLRVLSLRAHNKGLDLSCSLGKNIPYALSGDESRLRQILINLVGNAIKFTHEGSVVVKVKVDKEYYDRALLHFTVVDSGIGIAEEHRRRIFEPFIQADSSTTREYGGTGLGLSISKALVEMMDGKIWCESEPGEGSVFHFTAVLKIRSAEGETLVPQGSQDLAGLRVLIVESDAGDAVSLEAIVRNWKMEPSVAGSIQTAIDALREARLSGAGFDFILVDTAMPGSSGFRLAEYLIEHPEYPLPLMILTSARQSVEADRCTRLQLPAYVVKPVSESDLFDALMSIRGSSMKEAIQKEAEDLRQREHADGVRILLVEDNPVNQEVARQMLERRGYRIRIASNGREAVELVAQSADFDLILMDIQMPEMDGLQATAAIREMENKGMPHLPIVAMTAHAMKGDRERCLEAGMDAYVSKPVQSKVLFETIESILKPDCVPETPNPVPVVPVSTTPVLNQETVLERLGGDFSLLQSVVDLFTEDSPGQVKRIRDAILAQDPDALTSAAHSLKGSLLVLSADRASATALKLEKMGREAQLGEAETTFKELECELAELSGELQRMVMDLKGVLG